MENKITVSGFAAMIALATGQSGKLCEDFLRELFAIIAEQLEQGESVRIKGFGTFKTVDIEARKSVDVTTGEENEIPPHKRVVFVASKELAEVVNSPFEIFEAVEVSDALPTDELTETFDTPANEEFEESEPANDLEEAGDDLEEAAEEIEKPTNQLEEIAADYIGEEVKDEPTEDKDATPDLDESPKPGIEEVPVSGLDVEAEAAQDNVAESEISEQQVLQGVAEQIREELEKGESEMPDNPQDSGNNAPDIIEPGKSDSDIIEPDDLMESEEHDLRIIKLAKRTDPSEEVKKAAQENVGPVISFETKSSDDEEMGGRDKKKNLGFQDRIQTIHFAPAETDEEKPHDPPATGKFGKGFLIGFISGMLLLAAFGLIAIKCGWIPLQSEDNQKDSDFTAELASDQSGAPVTTLPADTIATDSEKVVDSGMIEEEVPTQASDAPVYDTVSTTRYLTTMAKEHYGNFNLWPIIYEENKAILGHPDRIKPGTRVVVPPLSKYHIDPSDPEHIQKVKQQGVAIYQQFKTGKGRR